MVPIEQFIEHSSFFIRVQILAWLLNIEQRDSIPLPRPIEAGPPRRPNHRPGSLPTAQPSREITATMLVLGPLKNRPVLFVKS